MADPRPSRAGRRTRWRLVFLGDLAVDVVLRPDAPLALGADVPGRGGVRGGGGGAGAGGGGGGGTVRGGGGAPRWGTAPRRVAEGRSRDRTAGPRAGPER